MAKISVLGIDLGKERLQRGRARRVRRGCHAAQDETRDVGRAGKEAACLCCRDGGVLRLHHLGGVFASHGHDVRLMSPEYVRPYVKAQKNDDRDAEGIAEAMRRPTMRFVELKSQDQLDMQTLHRSRDRLVGGERTALINQLRAILLEKRVESRRRASGSSSSS